MVREHEGGRASLEEVRHCGVGLESFQSSLTSFSLPLTHSKHSLTSPLSLLQPQLPFWDAVSALLNHELKMNLIFKIVFLWYFATETINLTK